MKCLLAALGFKNEDITYNKGVILNTMEKYCRQADIILFGEAYLQGFYGVDFNVKHDAKVAVEINSPHILEICRMAKEKAVAVSFGFIEKDKDKFYSSQITVNAAGEITDLYRRISPGWKEPYAGKEYCEGLRFRTFAFMKRKIAVGLCGDLWFDENIREIRKLKPDILFWPVYTDYNYEAWNTTVKWDYAKQAGRLCDTVLYVNSYCLDKDGQEIAKGGAALFSKGSIREEIPAGKEGVLLLEI